MNSISDSSTFSNKSIFAISYDLLETKQHSISAETLGQSLVNMSQLINESNKLINESNKLINGDDSEIELQVKAHKPGSFTVELIAWYNAGGKELLDILGFTGQALVGATASTASIFGVLKHLKDKKIKLTKKNVATGNSVIETEDGQRIECSSKIAELVTNSDIRKNLSEIVNKPIAGKDKASFRIKDENGTILTEVKNDDAKAFVPISAKSVTTTVESETRQYQIAFAAVNFDSISSGWKVFLPKEQKPTTIKMKDQTFINRINNGYAEFSKDKQYLVSIEKEITYQDGKIIKTTYNLKEVVRTIGDKH